MDVRSQANGRRPDKFLALHAHIDIVGWSVSPVGPIMSIPETRYAESEGVHIAYQVVGNGPFDLVFVPGFVSNLEHHWTHPVSLGL